MWTEPRRANGQYVGAGEGFIYSINVVPRYACTLVTQELWQSKKGGSLVRATKTPLVLRFLHRTPGGGTVLDA